MIMRLAYSFTWGGRTFECAGCPIGDTTYDDWFERDGGADGTSNKWSAIYHALRGVHEAIEDAFPNQPETAPEMFGFTFTELSEAI